MNVTTQARRQWVILCGVLAVLAGFMPAAVAQGDGGGLPLRDPADLAVRYLGLPEAHSLPIPDLRDMEAGSEDTVSLPLQGADAPTPVGITLLSGARASLNVPGALVWAVDGVEVSDVVASQAAQSLAGLFAELSNRAYYAPSELFPGTNSTIPASPIRVPDIDQDGFIHVVYAQNIANDRDAWVSPIDGLPTAYVAGEGANAREMIIINTTPYGADVPINDALYLNAAAVAFIDLVLEANNPHMPAWMHALVSSDIQARLAGSEIGANVFNAYLAVPSTPITASPTFTTREVVRGAHGLFLGYLRQRLGPDALSGLALTIPESGDPFAMLDQAIAAAGLVDPATGAVPDARALYADYVVTAIINAVFGDGRYAFDVPNVTPEMGAAATRLVPDSGAEGEISPFGSTYFFLTAEEAVTIDLTFEGAASIPSLRLPADTPHDTAYWSGRAPGSDTHMTRAFDLTDADSAMLTFDLWHDLSLGWDYGYVSVSTDGGATWQPQPLLDGEGQPIPVPDSYGAAYGPGFTGVSNPRPAEPFPILGIIVSADGVTVGDVSPGGAAEQAGVLPGDVVMGADGQPWQTQPNIVGLLANYSPGDTVTLMIMRDGEQIDVPVVLGAHPTRIRVPEPLWQPRSVDLSAYAGSEILLRFEAVLLPNRENWGAAVANIRLEDIGFEDEGTGIGWSFEGFSTISSALSAEWLVQTVTTGIVGASPPRVTQLIGSGDDANTVTRRYALGRNETLIVAVSATNAWTGAALPFTVTAAQVAD
ncbi:MAG: PDZ domain-containing protein [Pleurocapsa minor GSE-CHR-MK-17-07R]|jgi:hypothetical protein|nr:PDZ domain-containing protein [Pleurocapsa minor GSE-CHR-MK 17-07R]